MAGLPWKADPASRHPSSREPGQVPPTPACQHGRASLRIEAPCCRACDWGVGWQMGMPSGGQGFQAQPRTWCGGGAGSGSHPLRSPSPRAGKLTGEGISSERTTGTSSIFHLTTRY